ncbi:MAG: molybdenum cofactor biosynthesis protein MoaE [Methylococcales bacterium]|nr:molybdenum cofactor biosynthesis protein MoaE [Methylococcales bacterium]MDD5754054.1 molybdenum cofactor biosynthesis protein MoaE [Methylococcales bacterium]
MTIKICDVAFEPFTEIQNFQNPLTLEGKFGATSIFIGTMRDFNDGDDVQAMTLEHYDGMTQKQLAQIIVAAKAKWQILECLIVHRVGDILPNEPIVLVAVWSAHRGEAFEACRYLMEELKTNAPFWKLEKLATNETRWVAKNTAKVKGI